MITLTYTKKSLLARRHSNTHLVVCQVTDGSLCKGTGVSDFNGMLIRGEQQVNVCALVWRWGGAPVKEEHTAGALTHKYFFKETRDLCAYLQCPFKTRLHLLTQVPFFVPHFPPFLHFIEMQVIHQPSGCDPILCIFNTFHCEALCVNFVPVLDAVSFYRQNRRKARIFFSFLFIIFGHRNKLFPEFYF